MKKVLFTIALFASFVLAKECRTVQDQITGCTITEIKRDGKDKLEKTYKNKQLVLWKEENKAYYDFFDEKTEQHSKIDEILCYHSIYISKRNNDKKNRTRTKKVYDENGNFLIEFRTIYGDKYDSNTIPYNGMFKSEYFGGTPSHNHSHLTPLCNANTIAKTRKDPPNYVREVGEFKKGVRTGLWREEIKYIDRDNNYNVKGEYNLAFEGQVQNNKRVGLWKFYVGDEMVAEDKCDNEDYQTNEFDDAIHCWSKETLRKIFED